MGGGGFLALTLYITKEFSLIRAHPCTILEPKHSFFNHFRDTFKVFILNVIFKFNNFPCYVFVLCLSVIVFSSVSMFCTIEHATVNNHTSCTPLLIICNWSVNYLFWMFDNNFRAFYWSRFWQAWKSKSVEASRRLCKILQKIETSRKLDWPWTKHTFD